MPRRTVKSKSSRPKAQPPLGLLETNRMGTGPANSSTILYGDRRWRPAAAGGGGETNTASNVGSSGVGVYKEKVGVDLRFKKLAALSGKILIVDDSGNSRITFDISMGLSDVTGLVAALAGKSDTGHGHAIAAITGLQAALDALALGITQRSDFVFFYDGYLQVLPPTNFHSLVKQVDTEVELLEVDLEEAPTGRDVIVEFFKNGVSIGTVTVEDGDTYGFTTLGAPVTFTAGDKAKAYPVQVGQGALGKTGTFYMRASA